LADFEEDTYSRIFSTLRHPVRRKILRILSENQMSYTGILKYLKVTTGFLNYHLENMSSLISKNDNGQYYVSSFGKAALVLISNVEMSEKTPRDLIILNKKIDWKYVALFFISILIMSNIFVLYNNNQIYNKESTILLNKSAQNRNLTNKIIGIINTTINEGRIDFLTQRNLVEYTGELSDNYEILIQLTELNNEKLLQVKKSMEDLNSFLKDWNNVYMTYLIMKNKYNYNNITKIQIDSLEIINNDLIKINKLDLFSSYDNLQINQNELSQIYSLSKKLQIDVASARSAFYTGTFDN
jgi:hypothetical protein